MVLCIIQILKVHEGQNGAYPPAVVAMLVLSILQMLYLLYVIARSGKGAILKASSIAGAFVFFLLFNLGTPCLGVQRHTLISSRRHHLRDCASPS
jgi:hypothetical protein